jgi:hypothetical protein
MPREFSKSIVVIVLIASRIIMIIKQNNHYIKRQKNIGCVFIKERYVNIIIILTSTAAALYHFPGNIH